MPKDPKKFGDIKGGLDTMETEAVAFPVLIGHPNIVRAIGHIAHQLPAAMLPPGIRQPGSVYSVRPAVTHLALEFCLGGSLASYIE